MILNRREKLKLKHDSAWNRICRTSLLSDSEVQCSILLIPLIYLVAIFGDFTWISAMPDSLYDPPAYSLAILGSGFPSFGVLAVVQSVMVLSIAFLALGKRPILSGCVFCVAFMILSNFKYCFGKIDHNILLPIVVLCVAVGGTTSQFKESRLLNRLFPVRTEALLALAISFGMFTAGLDKSANWIDFDMSESGFMRWFYSGYINKGRVYMLADLVPQIHPLIIESFDYIAVIFELSPLLLLLLGRPLYWRLWLTFACFFHIGNLLFLNIAFILNFVVYLPFLLPKNLVSFVLQEKVKIILMVTIMVLAGWTIVSTWTELPKPLSLFIQGTVMKLWFSLILWGILAACGLIKCVELYRGESLSKKS